MTTNPGAVAALRANENIIKADLASVKITKLLSDAVTAPAGNGT